MQTAIDELDPTETLLRAASVLRRRRAVEVEDLLVVAHWADLHAADPRTSPEARRAWPPGGDRLVRVGGEGTPLVQELSLPELAIARQVHPLSARAALADVVDLRHRLPATWSRVAALEAEVWVARKVAAMTRDLSVAGAALVDAAVADAITGQAPSRVLELAAAKVIEADRAAHQARLEAERRRKFVALSRTDQHGLRHLIARVEAGDAAWLDAMVDRVAEILLARPELRPTTPAEIGKDEARALGLGWLARPAELLALLLEHAEADESESAGEPSRALAPTERSLALLRSTDLARLRPRATLYVHLHQAALAGECVGVARVEGIGPVASAQVRDLLGGAEVVVRPVIDLNAGASTSAYEHPEAVKERSHLRMAGEVFPHAARTSRSVDLDHPVPYDPLGPPGQTGDHNVAPLSRTSHRAKTHLGYRVRQTALEEYAWATPHGQHRIVDPAGTHLLDPGDGDALFHGDDLDRALVLLTHRLRQSTSLRTHLSH